MGSKKPQSIPPGMERPAGLPTSPPPKAGDEYYKGKLQELVKWLANEEAKATDLEKQSWENGDQLREMIQLGKAGMAVRARHWIRENIKGIK